MLLNKCFDKHNGEYYSLPGGGQHTSETLNDAIVRECFEETGYKVKVNNFVGIFEEICKDEELVRLYPDYAHKMYHIFLCELDNEVKEVATEIDIMQLGVEWIKISHLNNVTLMPMILNENILEMIKNKFPKFLGTDFIEKAHG